jgi:hypothetical protein
MIDPYATYRRLVELLKAGVRLPEEQLTETLKATGRDHASLVRDVFTTADSVPRPGDRCQCGGTLGVYSSRRRGPIVVQYLRCRQCGRRPGRYRRSVPGDAVARRRTGGRSV